MIYIFKSSTSFLLLGAIFVLLAACTPLSATQNTVQRASALPPTPSSSDKQSLEIFTAWGPGTEFDALHALEKVYLTENPDVVINHIQSGGNGGTPNEFLLERLRKEQPPDTLIIHAGKESLDYVNRGELEPITKLFKEEGFENVMPPLLLQQITIKGEIYNVPVNIQRSNVLWYNPMVFQANQLQPPRTIEDFFTVAEKFQAKGITPLAIGGGFELGHLFESILVATYGPDDYVRFVHGDPAMWADARLNTATHTFKKMLDYANADRGSMAANDAAQRVLDGKAGMTVMGDWIEGYYKRESAKPAVDFSWVPSPGTDGTFIWLSDSFALAKGAPHRNAAIEFLKAVGSKDGQNAFNPIKGSIAARTDIDKSLYDEYLQWSLDRFQSEKLVPSIAHGAATPESFRSTYSRAAIDFSGNLNEQALAEALRGAAVELTR